MFRDTIFLKEDSDLEKQINELKAIRDKVKDIHPRSGKETFSFNVSYDNMCKLISDENVHNIECYIKKKVA